MIPKECKRLAEVDFPIAVVSAHSAREKSIRHGHPSTLHLWWARRPLAACRAMLLALLLPDPCDENCPADFKEKARPLLKSVQGEPGPKDFDLRKAILKFIGDFSNWDLASNLRYLEVGRGLVRAAHGEEAPLVVDPFAGGGSIPLEALRLGCETFASDLNPVAVMVLKAMIEDIPRQGSKLAAELRRVGAEIKERAEQILSVYYPTESDGTKPIAYLWARTVQCERCGAEIPLLRTTWLAKRFNKSRKQYTKLVSLGVHGNRDSKKISLSIDVHDVPTSRLPDIPPPTITGGVATCRCCPGVLSAPRVRAQLTQQKGGSDSSFDKSGTRESGARLMAVAVRRAEGGLLYRLPTPRDYSAVCAAQKKGAALVTELPSEPISAIRPSPNARGVSGATRIGITDFGRVFTARQKLALSTLSSEVGEVETTAKHLLCLAISKLAERSTCFVTWINSTEAPRGTFARQALTIAWDFIELVPIANEEEFSELIDAMTDVVEQVANAGLSAGQVTQAKASDQQLPDESADIWFTDPPYYDSVPYSDLSDLFYVWLKRMVQPNTINVLGEESSDGLTPKTAESVWNEAHIVDGEPKTPEFFEKSLAKAFSTGRRTVADNGIACIVFAHKSTEGWEALLSGILHAGWVVVASWPVATERKARLNAKESAALATSVHLVCRPRPEGVSIGDWGEISQDLPKRTGDWMERLSDEGVRGADLVFACIGPAMELYSRYSKVEDAQGREIPLGGDPEAVEPYKRGFLAYVWETVGRIALEQILGTAEARARNGAAGALEEDARLTALFLWTIQSTATNGTDSESDEGESEDGDEEGGAGKSKKGLTLVYDVARRFAQPLGIHLDRWESRIIVIEKGIVRLLPVMDRAEQLLGEDGAIGAADLIERTKGKNINYEFAFAAESEDRPSKTKPSTSKAGAARDEAPAPKQGTTTLDHVHIAMLLQKSGKSNALRTMLKSEIERGPDFLRLANALSALYPKDSEEKRLLDAMLLAAPR